MTFFSIAVAFLGGSAFAAAITKLGDYLIAKFARKNKLADEKAEKEAALAELKAEQEATAKMLKAEIAELKDEVGAMVKGYEIVNMNQRLILTDRLYFLCKTYIKQQHIDHEDRRNLVAIHEGYHKDGGNGDFDNLMAQVMELPVDF